MLTCKIVPIHEKLKNCYYVESGTGLNGVLFIDAEMGYQLARKGVESLPVKILVILYLSMFF